MIRVILKKNLKYVNREFWIPRIKDAPKRRSWEESGDNVDDDVDDELSESQKGGWTNYSEVYGPRLNLNERFSAVIHGS